MKKQDLGIKMKKIGSVPPLCANGELAVRCAKAELELEREREFRKTDLAILASMGERERSRAQETEELGRLLALERGRVDALRAANRALLDENATVSGVLVSAYPRCPEFPELDSGFYPLAWFFGLAAATGLCTWAWGLVEAVAWLLGRLGS